VALSDVYIISDLHLCDGGPLEDFRADDERALVSFLFHLRRQPPATLIINGDWIDFVQIQPRPQMWHGATLDASEAESLEKLELALLAHAPVFDALGRLLQAGHSLRIHTGNHDIDLLWPRVQARLRERLGRSAHAAIAFGDAYLHAGLYVEHGHQADPVNSFPRQPDIVHPDPYGVLRLERCWGTRLVEEFYNQIEALDGCAMLDNVRPRIPAALIVIRHALVQPAMHDVLRAGLRIVVDTLASLRTEQDLTNAAHELGLSRRVLGWLASVAGWLSAGPYVAKSASPLVVPSLQAAWSYGADLPDPQALVQYAPDASDAPLMPKAPYDSAARRLYQQPFTQRFVQRANEIAQRHAAVTAVCFGHTHRAIVPELQIDGMNGWPLPATPARFFNSGSWTRTLDLDRLPPDQHSFAVLTDPASYRRGRDYLQVRWTADGQPQVELRAWM
jgi:UDP-2,3-diacylglucosamine pyrophosphatase LpxH